MNYRDWEIVDNQVVLHPPALEYPKNHFLDREWLHIHVLDGTLYVFSDDGHWENSPTCGWQDEQELAIKDLDKECMLGPIDTVGDLMWRIRMNPPKPKLITTKFGIQYWT